MEEKILIKGIFGKSNIVSTILYIATPIWFICAFMTTSGMDDVNCLAYLGCGVLCFVLALIFQALINKCELTVTSKRVYGKAAFGKRVDLPLDKISSAGMCAFKGIGVGTSSGRISFFVCRNRDEVYNVISKLLMMRQEVAKKAETVIKQEIHQSNGDELRKFKALLDDGIITQDEFDAKKKQLLGI